MNEVSQHLCYLSLFFRFFFCILFLAHSRTKQTNHSAGQLTFEMSVTWQYSLSNYEHIEEHTRQSEFCNLWLIWLWTSFRVISLEDLELGLKNRLPSKKDAKSKSYFEISLFFLVKCKKVKVPLLQEY